MTLATGAEPSCFPFTDDVEPHTSSPQPHLAQTPHHVCSRRRRLLVSPARTHPRSDHLTGGLPTSFPFLRFSLTTFSPSGKLAQIEHALAAVQAGTTSLGIKGKRQRTNHHPMESPCESPRSLNPPRPSSQERRRHRNRKEEPLPPHRRLIIRKSRHHLS